MNFIISHVKEILESIKASTSEDWAHYKSLSQAIEELQDALFLANEYRSKGFLQAEYIEHAMRILGRAMTLKVKND